MFQNNIEDYATFSEGFDRTMFIVGCGLWAIILLCVSIHLVETYVPKIIDSIKSFFRR